jgi:hypothetical protein
MACVNPSAPEYLEILKTESNPLLAEIEYDRLYDDEGNINHSLSNFTSDQENNNYGEYLDNLELNSEEQGLLEKSINRYEERPDDGGIYGMVENTTRKSLQTSNRVLYNAISRDNSNQFDRIANFDEFKNKIQKSVGNISSSDRGSDGENMRQIFNNPKLDNTSKGLVFSQYIGRRLLQSPDTVIGRTFDSIYQRDKGGKLFIVDGTQKGMLYSLNGDVYLSIEDLQNELTKYDNYSHFEHWLEGALQEEVIHATVDSLTTQLDRDQIYSEMTDGDRDTTINYYNSTKTLSKNQIVSEYLRMLVQQNVFGVTTEFRRINPDNSGLRKLFTKVLNYLLKLFKNKPKDSFIKFVVNRVSNYINSTDDIQFNRPITYQEQLSQLKERYHLAPVEKYGTKGYDMTLEGAKAISKQFQKSGYLYNKLNLRYNSTIGVLEINPKEFDDVMQMNRAEQEKIVGTEIFNKVVGKLADKIGTSYQIVTAEEAQELTKDSKIPYNGEKAFYYKGTAYVLDSALTVNNGIHEVMHPFTDIIAKSNPELFDKIYSDLSSTNAGARIIQEVHQTYGEDFNTEQQQKEVIVRMLSDLVEGNIEAAEEPKVRSILSRIFFALKQLFRKLFTKTVNLQNLNENTTLQELADMLTSDDFKIDSKVVSEEDVIQFKRDYTEVIDDLRKLPNSALIESINQWANIENQHDRVISTAHGFKEVKESITPIGSRSLTSIMRNALKDAEITTDEFEQARGLAYTIDTAERMTGMILDKLTEINAEPETVQNLMRLSYFGQILREMKEFTDSYSKFLSDSKQVPSNSALFKTMGKLTQNITLGIHQLTQNNLEAVTDLLAGVHSPTQINLIRDHEAKLANYREKLKTNPSAQRFIDRENKVWKEMDRSPENIKKYLMGEMGDASWWSGMFEAYISNSNPIVGGYMQFIKEQLYVTDAEMRNFDNDMRTELAPHYKAANVNRSNPAELGKQLLAKEKTLEFVDGVPTESEKLMILNQFTGYQYDKDKFDHDITEARDKKDTDKLRQLLEEREDFENNYMHRRYAPEWYKLRDIWKSDTGAIAYSRRFALIEEIKRMQDSLSNDPEEMKEELKGIDLKWREYVQLGSLTDLNGNMKVDTPDSPDLSIAKLIKEYNEKSREFQEWIPIANLFETRYNEYKQSLFDQGLDEATAKDKLQQWLDENTHTKLHQSFYDDRQQILDRISEILAQLPDADRKKVEVSAGWLTIIEQTKGFRDDNGQPIGSDMTTDKIAAIKAVQEAIVEAQKNYTKLSGLSENEAERLNTLFAIKKSQGKWTDAQRDEVKELTDRKSEIKKSISPLEFTELFQLFDQLRELQSKVPTDYYLEIINNYLSKMDHPLIEGDNAEDFLSGNMDALFEKDPEFKSWFEKNHISRTRWNNNTKQMEPYFERLYVWNRIRPNNPKYLETTKLTDGTTLLGVPNNSYFRRAVKKEYQTGYNPATKEVHLIIGVHKDNKGFFLPKTIASGAKDSKYINKDYDRLKQNNPNLFNILQTFTKYHLKAQEGLQNSNKLWMEYPRFRAENLEYLQSGTLMSDAVGKVKQLAEAGKAALAVRKDDFTRGVGNYEDDLKDRIAPYAMFNSSMVRIPQKGLTKIAMDQVSLDMGRSILLYAQSAMVNKQLVKINPIGQALQNVVEANGINDIEKVGKGMFATAGAKIFSKSRKKDKNVTAQILANMNETILEGKRSHNELGEGMNKFLRGLMKLTALSSLSFNAPGALKNMFAANVQNFIETLGGASINSKEYIKGKMIMHNRFIPAMMRDYNKISDQSLETQLWRMFDPVQGKGDEKLGHEFTNANARNATNLHVAMFGMEVGEIEAQGSFWIGMMVHQKVKQTLNGVTKEIPYVEAFEKDNVTGVVKLKEGIDPVWAEGGKEMVALKMRNHEYSQKMQGNYADRDQPEVSRYTTGGVLNFMRRYFVPGATNRYSNDRVQSGIQSRREGYYRTFMRASQNTLVTHKINWGLYSTEEKGNILKTTAEIGISAMFMLALRMVGWNPNDKDKYKKMQENSWALNHLIYQLLAVKSEAEQFIPIPGMGADEVIRLVNTPSIALGHLSKWYRLFGDMGDLVGVGLGLEDSDKLYLQQKQGFWEKGDSKLWMHLQKIVGLTGATVDPIVGTKNIYQNQSRLK